MSGRARAQARAVEQSVVIQEAMGQATNLFVDAMRALEEEARRRAEAEARRRAQELERQRRAQERQELERRARGTVSAARGACEEAQSARAQELVPETWEKARSLLSQAEQDLARGQVERAIERARQAQQGAQRARKEAIVRAEQDRKAQEEMRRRAEAEEAIAEAKAAKILAENPDATKFCSQELASVIRLLDQAQSSLQKGIWNEARSYAQNAQKAFERIQEVASQRATKYQAEKESAAAVVNLLAARVTQLDAVPPDRPSSMNWWLKEDFASVKQHLADMQTLLGQEQFDKTQQMAKETSERLNELEKRLQEFVKGHARRDTLATMVGECMVQLGYDYSVNYTKPEDLKSAIMFATKDRPERNVTVWVSMDGTLEAKYSDYLTKFDDCVVDKDKLLKELATKLKLKEIPSEWVGDEPPSGGVLISEEEPPESIEGRRIRQ